MSDKTSNVDLQAIQSIDKDFLTRPGDAGLKPPILLLNSSLCEHFYSRLVTEESAGCDGLSDEVAN